MTFQTCLKGAFLSALAGGLLMPAVQAEETPAPRVKTVLGTLVGILTNSAKLPIATVNSATVRQARAAGGQRFMGGTV